MIILISALDEALYDRLRLTTVLVPHGIPNHQVQDTEEVETLRAVRITRQLEVGFLMPHP